MRHAHFRAARASEQERVVGLVVDVQRQEVLAAELVGGGARHRHHQRDVVIPTSHAVEVGEVESRCHVEEQVHRHRETRAAERRVCLRLAGHEEQTCIIHILHIRTHM